MATNVSRDSILDAMVTALRVLRPAVGDGISVSRYVRKVDRLMGRLENATESFQRGVAGNCPCIFVGVDGDPRRIRTTIGRRVDRVETGFKAICFSDKQKDRDDRSNLLSMCEDVRRLVGARRFGLAIQPMRWVGEHVEIDNDALLAIAVRFTTRHYVDYSIEAQYDRVLEVEGEVHLVDDDGNNVGNETPLHIVFP